MAEQHQHERDDAGSDNQGRDTIENARRAEREFERLISVVPHLVVVFNDRYHVLQVNPALERLLGWTTEELNAQGWASFAHPDDAESTRAALAAIRDVYPGVANTFEHRFRARDGSYRWLSWVVVCVPGEDVIYGMAEDVTARQLARAAQEAAEQRLRTVTANVAILVWAIDTEGWFTLVQGRDQDRLGSKVQRERVSAFAYFQDAPDLVGDLKRGLAGEAFSAERAFHGRILESHFTPLRDEDGRVNGLGGVTIDVTDRKRAAEAEEVERASRAKSEFLSRMSHELRTPLNIILGFAQLLELDAQTPEQEEAVRHILQAGRHLLGLIDEVLDISRIETNQLALDLKPTAIDVVLGDTRQLIQPLADQLEVVLEAVPPPPVRFVLADEQRLRQVFLNLYSNAIKYNRRGGHVRIAFEARGETLFTHVIDEGRGIAPEQVSRLFQPFERLGAEATGVEGTGLGLALSRTLVEAMNGTIGLESEPGAGSDFWCTFPVAPEAEGATTEAATASPEALSARRPRTILYIEDTLMNVTMVERVVRRRPDLSLLLATRGEAGIALAQEHRPDLVLLDLQLPDTPGEAVLRRLKHDPRTAAIPVVVVATADVTPQLARRLAAAGAAVCLAKPIDVKQLLLTVDQLTQREDER